MYGSRVVCNRGPIAILRSGLQLSYAVLYPMVVKFMYNLERRLVLPYSPISVAFAIAFFHGVRTVCGGSLGVGIEF